MPQTSKVVVRISFFMDSQIVAQFITFNPDRYRQIAFQPPTVPLGQLWSKTRVLSLWSDDRQTGSHVLPLPFAPVEDLEVIAGVGGEEAGDVAEALGQGGGGQQRILALAQIVVVEVNGQRQHVNSQRVGEG